MKRISIYRPLAAVAAALILFCAPLSAATIWDESANGDFSFDSNTPTSIGTLTVGDNLVNGSLVGDFDAFWFSVPLGTTLNGIILNSQTGTGSANFYFVRGTAYTSGVKLATLNWTNSKVQPGDNLLTKGGSGSVGSGNYEIVLAGFGDNISQYTLNLRVASIVPEPGFFPLFALCLVVAAFGARFIRKAV